LKLFIIDFLRIAALISSVDTMTVFRDKRWIQNLNILNIETAN